MQVSAMPSYALPARPRRRSKQRARRTRTLLVLGVFMALLAVFFLPRAVASSQESSAPIVHTVERGDTLWEIASQYANQQDVRVVIQSIQRANGMKSVIVHPGQELVIPAR